MYRLVRSMGRGALKRYPLATIGYELATVPSLIAALRQARVDILVDVRAVASSRKKGFSKTGLAASLDDAGIDYLHLRGLGTPADGRAAARSGRYADLERIYNAHLKTLDAKDDLLNLADLVKSGRHACLLCLEASAEHCHRTMVAGALGKLIALEVRNLFVEA